MGQQARHGSGLDAKFDEWGLNFDHLIRVQCVATALLAGLVCDCAFRNGKHGLPQLLRLAEEGVNKKVMPAV